MVDKLATPPRGPVGPVLDPATRAGPPPRRRRPSRFRVRDRRFLVFQLPLIALLAGLVVAPLVFIFYGAFQTTSLLGTTRFTTRNIEFVYATLGQLRIFLGTAALAAAVAAIALVVGAAFAWILSRTDTPWRSGLEIGILAPLFVSPFVGAMAWLILGSPRAGLLNVFANALFPGAGTVINTSTIVGVVGVMSLYYVPYGYVYVSTSLRNMDPAMEEASYMNGSGPLVTGLRVTLPLMRPALVSGFFFIFVLSAGLFSVAAVLGGTSGFQPLAVGIFQAANSTPSDPGRAAAIGSMLFWLTLCGIVLYRTATKYANRFVTVSGRGFRFRRIPLGGWKWVAMAGCVVYVLLSVVLPYLVLVYVTLTPYVQTDIFEADISLDAFVALGDNLLVQGALWHTLQVSVITPTIAVLLGLVTAFSIYRLRLRWGAVLDYIATIPIAVPGIVLATGLIWLYIRTPLYDTIWLLVIAFTVEYLPQALRISSNSLIQIDRSLEEASTMCGAGTTTTLRRITMPLMRPALVSAWILIFIFSTREIGSAILLYGPNSAVLSVLTWDYLNYGDLRSAAVIGLLQTGLMLIGILVARFVFRVKISNAQGAT